MSNEEIVISEIFHNIQGEGVFAGYPSYFLRTAGCSVKCAYCDTTYSWIAERAAGLASGIYQSIDVDSVIDQIVESNIQHVVITGGEPAEQVDALKVLTNHKRSQGRVFTIETSGNVPFEVADCGFHLISCSPKMDGMHARDKSDSRYDHLNEMITKQYAIPGRLFQLKFVIGNEKDFEQAKELIARVVPIDLAKRINIIFQPNNRNPSEQADTVLGLLQYVEMYKILMKTLMDDIKSGTFWRAYPQVRALVQNHWLGYGRTKGI